ncbi:MAG TPA: hypothetical protein VK543_19645, partial [Puia sp.]|nr:hypothetical protein [Puia sp.]
MKQIMPYTSRYPVNNVSITKRTKAVKALTRMFILVLAFSPLSEMIYSQNCPTSGTHSQSSNENTYYPGTQATVSAGATSITLGTAGVGTGFSATPIAIGDVVLIIQMQGAQINSSNSGLYGKGTGSGAGFTATNLLAGYMEYAVAANAVPVGGGTLNLVSGTTYSYVQSAFGAFGQYTYQIIRVPSFYNIQLTATVTTALWNGSTGGVTAINAVNQLNFNGKTINGSGAGFRGGAGRVLGGAPGLNKADYVTLATVTSNGSKAEGIAGTPTYVNNNGSLLNTGVEGYPNGSYGRGAPGNAGGGGTDYDPSANDQNDGGGGGGNIGPGGQGGNGWWLVGTSG